MIKKALYSVFLLLCCIYLPCAQAEEKITLSTFYPAPHGEYEYLAANSMVVGRTYPFPAEDNLIVEGNVGIGTTGPEAKLEVQGSDGASRTVMVDNSEVKFTGDGLSHWSIFGAQTGKNYFSIRDTSSSGEIGTAGSEKFVVLPTSGNIGIGTTSPSSRLHIRETGMGTAIPLVFLDAHYLSGGGGDGYAGDGSVLDVYTSRGDGFSDGYIARFRNSASTKLYIRGDGNVGIGTTNPGALLHIDGTSQLMLSRSGDNTWRIFTTDTGSDGLGIRDETAGEYRMFFAENGNVGIGTTSPNSRLDLGNSSGDIRIYDGNGTAHILGDQDSGETDGIVLRTTNNPASGEPIFVVESSGNSQRLRVEHGGYVRTSNSFYASGNIECGGTKSFVIDHPTRPEMKLVHSTLEGPEAAVFYRGQAQLVNGEAIIELPEYFEALSRKEDRTVQLSAKGAQPYLLSSTGISEGRFRVYGTKPDGEFYWEVKAVRADIEPLKAVVEREEGN